MINYTNMTTPGNLLAAANTNSGGFFWTGILYMVVIVLVASMINFGFEVAIMTALFIGIAAGIMLVYMGLMNITYLFPLIGLELFLIIYITVTSGRNQ